MPENNEDLVSKAEKVIKRIGREDNRNPGKLFFYLTTNQIRKFLSAISAIANKVNVYKTQNPNTDNLSQDLADEIRYLKILLVYQAGRERNVDTFVRESGLLQEIDKVGTSVAKFVKLSKYVEALVAYHKFYGGRD